MLSFYDLKKDEEKNNKINDLLLTRTKEFMQDEIDNFKNKAYDKISSDLEMWFYEHSDNALSSMFDELKDYMFAGKRLYSDKVKDFIKDIGFDAEKFRKRIYMENIEELTESIAWDAVFEKLDKMFDHYKFGIPYHCELNMNNYVVGEIQKRFIDYMTNKMEIKEMINSNIDNEIIEKRKELDKRKKELNEVVGKIMEAEDKLYRDEEEEDE